MAKKSAKKAVRSLGLATTSAEGAARLAKQASPSIPVEQAVEQPNAGQPGSDTKMAQSIPVKPVDPSANSGAGLAEPSMSEGSQTEEIPSAAPAPAANVVGGPVDNAQGVSQSSDVPAPGATKPSDNRSSMPSSTTNMSVGSPKESLPSPGASPSYKKNSPSVLKAHQASNEFEVSPRLAAMHARMQGKKKAQADWQDEVDHVHRQATAWDAGYTAAKAGKPLALAKVAYQKIDIGCMAEFADGYQARIAEQKTALNWEDAQKEIGEEGEITMGDLAGKTVVIHAQPEDHSDGKFMFHVMDESGEQLHAAGGYESLEAAKTVAEMWLASENAATKQAQGVGNDSPGTRNPDVAGMRPVSGEAIEGTGGPEVKMAEVQEEEASMEDLAKEAAAHIRVLAKDLPKEASAGDLTNIGKGPGVALSPEDYGRVLASLGHSKEAVDQATKDYYENYYGQYGKQLTKDETLKGPKSKSAAKTAGVREDVGMVWQEVIALLVKLRGAFDQMPTGVRKDLVETALGSLKEASDALEEALTVEGGLQARQAQGAHPQAGSHARALKDLLAELQEVSQSINEGVRPEFEQANSLLIEGISKIEAAKVVFDKVASEEGGLEAKQAKVATNEGKAPPTGHDTFGDSTAQDKGMQPATAALAFEVKDAALHGERNELVVGYDKGLNDVCSELQMKHHIKSFVQRLGGEMSKHWGVVADIQVQELDSKKAQAVVTFRALKGNSPFVPKVKVE